jgi:hypothetical protein
MAPRLLVVTRDPDVRAAVSTVLESAGYEVTTELDAAGLVAAVVVLAEASPVNGSLGLPPGLPIARVALETELQGAPSLMLPEIRTALLTKVAAAIGAAANGS